MCRVAAPVTVMGCPSPSNPTSSYHLQWHSAPIGLLNIQQLDQSYCGIKMAILFFSSQIIVPVLDLFVGNVMLSQAETHAIPRFWNHHL